MSVYACSDLHGMKHFYDSLREQVGPDALIFYLGDAGDRGPKPWETIKALLDDPKVIYIRGNHDNMIIDCLRDYLKKGQPYYEHARLLSCNGGDRTYKEAIADPNMEKYLQKLEKAPLYLEYVNVSGELVILSHAGFTPYKNDEAEKPEHPYRLPWNWKHELIWNRDHFFDEWNAEDCVDCFIIHGHTPIPYLLDEIDPRGQIEDIEPGALWYDNGRKCCVDCGAVFTGTFVALNLDNWDEEVFQSEPYL